MNPRSEERPRANPLLASSVKSSGSPIPYLLAACLGSVSVTRGGCRSRGTVHLQRFQAPGSASALQRGSGTAALWADGSQKRLEAAVAVSWDRAGGDKAPDRASKCGATF